MISLNYIMSLFFLRNKMRLYLVRDSQWHWLDGSIVDSSVITWCPDSTYETANGTYCAAYDSILQCINNYLCNTLLPAPCVSGKNK